MPMGPGPLGFVYFVGVKLAGYTVAGSRLKKVYGTGGSLISPKV